MPPDRSIVAIIAAHNEADIIEQVIGDLIAQRIGVYYLDDRSTDGSAAIVERHLGRGVLAVESVPPPGGAGAAGFHWEHILRRKAAIAATLCADWFIHHDADEFRESPWPHLCLAQAIGAVDALGYNAIDFASFDFWPTHDRFRPGDDVRAAFPYYSQSAHDRLQVRCWKNTGAAVDLAASGGHDASFAGRAVFPLRFILRHYPVRGQQHGERKVFRERKNRYLPEERSRGWHVQYDDVREGTSFIRAPDDLTRYDPDAVRVALTLRHRGVEALEQALACSQEARAAQGEAPMRRAHDCRRRRPACRGGAADCRRRGPDGRGGAPDGRMRRRRGRAPGRARVHHRAAGRAGAPAHLD